MGTEDSRIRYQSDPEFARGFDLGRAAAMWTKDKVGCPGDTVEAFARPAVSKALADTAGHLISDGRAQGQLSTSESVDGFREGFFVQMVALCVDGPSESHDERRVERTTLMEFIRAETSESEYRMFSEQPLLQNPAVLPLLVQLVQEARERGNRGLAQALIEKRARLMQLQGGL